MSMRRSRSRDRAIRVTTENIRRNRTVTIHFARAVYQPVFYTKPDVTFFLYMCIYIIILLG